MKYVRSFLKGIIIFVAVCVLAYMILVILVRPSNNRDWNSDQAVLPYAEILGSKVTVHNIRNFTYTSVSDYAPAYYDKTFDLDTIKNVYFIVEPFSGFAGAAHTFLSFEFEGNDFVSVSVEIRKEKGESFSALKGLFRQYEIMYVVGDERDVLKLRSNYRNDSVYVYPVVTTPEKMRAVFLSMIGEVNRLKQAPEFYNTLTNNCTTNIAKHINKVSPGRVSWNLTFLLPENSDRYAYSMGLIDNTIPFDEIRKKYFINDLAKKYADNEDFSLKIRGR